jgi:hypothetical protein
MVICDRYSATVNQLMVATFKLSKWCFRLNKCEPLFQYLHCPQQPFMKEIMAVITISDVSNSLSLVCTHSSNISVLSLRRHSATEVIKICEESTRHNASWLKIVFTYSRIEYTSYSRDWSSIFQQWQTFTALLHINCSWPVHHLLSWLKNTLTEFFF